MSSLVLSGDTSGTVTLSVPAVAGSNTISVQAATASMSVNTLATAVASTSGTSIDFTSIPAWVKRINIMVQGMSTNGTSTIQVQIGSGSVTTSGYLGAGSYVQSAGTTSAVTLTSGFSLNSNAVAAGIVHGIGSIILMNSSTNLYAFSSNVARSDAGSLISGAGSIALAGVLDRIRITMVNGTDTFDAGSVNILYEG